MRILITTWPAYGHFNPMLPTARAAQRAGHDVAIATGPDLAPHVEQRGCSVWPVRPSHAEAEAAFAATNSDLQTLPQEEQMQAAISDLFFAGAATRATDLVRQVPDLVNELYSATYLDICPPGLQPEGNRVWQSVQPLRPAAGEPATGERLPETLAALPYPLTIHLTLGTVFYEASGVLETAIAGLRELPFNLVVTTGPGTDPARFGPQPPHVLVEPYIPHTLLLPHCCLVVSHGGAGIMFGALAHGLPQLILPQGADQFWNADACQRVGAALALPPEAICAEAVAEAAQRLITEPAFTMAARLIQAEINTMPTAADVLNLLTTELPAPAH